jgi:hypothetical protein
MTQVDRRPDDSALRAGDFTPGRSPFVPEIANSTAGYFAGAQTYVSERASHANWNRQVVQYPKGVWLYRT